MSKILITENRLRNILFKNFLKNPKLLKEQEEDPQTDTDITDILKDVSNTAISKQYEKELLLLTIRRQWAASTANIIGIDPGESIFDHLIGSNIPEHIAAKWTYASQTERLSSKDMLDIIQLGTAVTPFDAFGKVANNLTRTIDLATSLVSAANNFLFAYHLQGLNKKSTSIKINKTGQTVQLKKGGLGNEPVWYYVYTACDAISAFVTALFFVDSKFINGALRKSTAEGENKLLHLIETDKNGNIKERIINTAPSPDVEVDIDRKKLAGDGGKTVRNLSYINAQSSEVIRNIINDINQDVVETFATTSKFSTGEADPFLSKIDDIIDSKNAAPVKKLEIDISTEDYDNLDRIDQIKYVKINKLPEEISDESYKNLTPETKEKYNNLLYISQDKNFHKGTYVRSLKDEYKKSQKGLLDYKLKDDEIAKQANTSQNINNSSELDITDSAAMIQKDKAKLKEKIAEIKLSAESDKSTVAYDIAVDAEIKKSANPFTITTKISQNNKPVETLNSINRQQMDEFYHTLEEFTGIDKDTFFKEINSFLKDNKLINSEINITPENFVEIYNKLISTQGQTPIKSSLLKKLNTYSDLIKGKAKLRKITQINEVFSPSLKQKYIEKLKNIDAKIITSINDQQKVDQLFKILKDNPRLANDEIQDLIRKNLNLNNPDLAGQLYVLIKNRQNNVKEALNLSLDRRVFDYVKYKKKHVKDSDDFYKEFDSYFDISKQFNAKKSLYYELIELNYIDEYLYRRRLSRYHKGMNVNLTSKIDAILDLIDPENMSSFARNDKELKEAFEKFKIGKVIDGTLRVDDANTKDHIENLYQYFKYLKRFMDRYESTCDIINDTDVLKETDYIFNLLDKNIIDFSQQADQGQTLLTLLGFETVEQLNAAKNDSSKLKKLIREKSVNKEFSETINKGFLKKFVDVDRVNVKIPELISNQLIEDMSTAGSKFQLNYGRLVNLVNEIGNLDEAFNEIIDINRKVIVKLKDRKQALMSGINRGANVEAEAALIDLQISFLDEFNIGFEKFVNNTRKKSGLGNSGLNVLENKLVTTKTGNQQQYEKVNKILNLIKSEEGNNTLTKVTYIGAFIQWFNNLFTKFKGRKAKNLSSKLLGGINTSDIKDKDSVWTKFSKLFEEMKRDNPKGSGWFNLFIHLTGAPGGKLELKNYLPGINSVLGTVAAIKQYMFMNVLLGVSQTAIFATSFVFFLKGYILGIGLHLAVKLLAHSLPEFRQIGIGIAVSMRKSLANITKQLTQILAVHRRDINNEIARALEGEDNYMDRLQKMSDIEDDDTQSTIFGKGITDEMSDLIIEYTGLDNVIKQNYNSGTIFKELDQLYNLYVSLPNSLSAWHNKMLIKNPDSPEWSNYDEDITKLEQQIKDIQSAIKNLDNKKKKKKEREDLSQNLENLNSKLDQLRKKALSPDKVVNMKKIYYDTRIGKIYQSLQKTLNVNNLNNIGNQQLKFNEFSKAVIVLNILDNFSNNSDDLKLQSDTLNTLNSMIGLRKQLKNKIEVLAECVSVLGSKDFNVDSLITGGYHSVKVTGAKVDVVYAKRYKYKATEDDSNKVPHFKQTTALSNGQRINNMALEIYSYQKMKDTQGLFMNPMNLAHTALKSVEDAIDTINIATTAYDNMIQGLPANSNSQSIKK